MSIRRTLSSEYTERFPALGLLVSGYFLVAADDDATPEDAVCDFVREQPPAVLSSAAAGLQALLDECPDEVARVAELERLGWNFYTEPGELDALLVRARDHLRTAS